MSEGYVLIVEDDERIGSTLLRALEGSGFDAAWERTGESALASVEARRPAVVLLDVGLPGMDGFEVTRRVREQHPTLPIVMLTARADELDVVAGLEAGAIDYVVKPFKLAELLARLRAQIRRTSVEEVPATTSPWQIGDLAVDVRARRVWLAESEVDLRAKEFDLLVRLMQDAGNVVTREALMADVWDEHWFGSTKTLDFHISSLRRRIDPPDGPSRITTMRGVGYRYESQ